MTGGRVATRIIALKSSMKKIHTATNSVNFGPVTPEILWLIRMVGDCREANMRTVQVKGHSLGVSSIAGL